MADTPTSAPASGPSSTPPAAPAAAAAAPSAPATPAQTSGATAPTEPPKTASDPQTGSEPPQPGETPKDPANPAPADTPLYTLPEDFTPPDAVRAKFDSAIKGAMVDGKLSMSPQQVSDLYVDLIRDANTVWQKQLKDLDAANLATCQKQFTPAQLSAAESAVGWASSYNPAFREFAQRQLNDPVFVGFMRLIGEALQEDEFIPAAPPNGSGKRTPAQRMGYAK